MKRDLQIHPGAIPLVLALAAGILAVMLLVCYTPAVWLVCFCLGAQALHVAAAKFVNTVNR